MNQPRNIKIPTKQKSRTVSFDVDSIIGELEVTHLLSLYAKQSFVTLDLESFIADDINKHGKVLDENYTLLDGSTYYSGERYTTASVVDGPYDAKRKTSSLFSPKTVVFAKDLGTLFGVCSHSLAYKMDNSAYSAFDVYYLPNVMQKLLTNSYQYKIVIEHRDNLLARMLSGERNLGF